MFKKILLPIDLQETALAAKATRIAVSESRQHGAEIYLLAVVPGFGMPVIESFFPDDTMQKVSREVESELQRFIAANFPPEISVHPVISQGSPVEQILAECRLLKADLIIIPSHNKNLGQVLLGSCASGVVSQANCTVMVVKG